MYNDTTKYAGNGKKKALCVSFTPTHSPCCAALTPNLSLAPQIGVNYIGTSQELRGCINDAHNMMKFLCDRFGYQQEDIVLLTDDASNPRQIPTRENMIAAMQWLVDGAQPNDSLFFH